MFGHWVSQTRKLNKHYQSESVSVPMWTDFSMVGCGLTLTTPADPILTLRPDGFWVCLGSVYSVGRVSIPPLNGSQYLNYQYDKVILAVMLLDGIKFNGFDIPLDNTCRLTDSTGKIKFKFDTVNLTYTDANQNVFTHTEMALILYVDYVDYPKTATGWGAFNATNCRFNRSFRFPKGSPLRVSVERNSGILYNNFDNTFDTLPYYNYAKDFEWFNAGGYDMIGGNCPVIGSKIQLHSIESISASSISNLSIFDPFFGGFYIRDDTTGTTYTYNVFDGISDITGQYAQLTNHADVSYTIGSGTSSVQVTIGSEYDGVMLISPDTINMSINPYIGVTTFDGCEVVGWQ